MSEHQHHYDNATEAVPVAPVLDLAAPRTIVLKGAGDRTYKLGIRRVGADDWREYFDAVTITSKREGKDIEQSFDLDTPRRMLAERVLIGAEGYEVARGGSLTELPDWQRRLPLAHRLKVGEILAGAHVVQTEDFTIYPEGEPVYLDAPWTADADGNLQIFKGLKHVLKTPTEAQYRRFARENSRTRILGGDRSGTTQYPGAQRVLAELYDELVVEIEGYSWGEARHLGRDVIATTMDMHHKVLVALQIFQPQENVVATVAKEG